VAGRQCLPATAREHAASSIALAAALGEVLQHRVGAIAEQRDPGSVQLPDRLASYIASVSPGSAAAP